MLSILSMLGKLGKLSKLMFGWRMGNERWDLEMGLDEWFEEDGWMDGMGWD